MIGTLSVNNKRVQEGYKVFSEFLGSVGSRVWGIEEYMEFLRVCKVYHLLKERDNTTPDIWWLGKPEI